MSIRLRELIRKVRACKSAADERKVVSKECANIRTQFKEKVDSGLRNRNVAKLLYIHMLGYPTHFGQMECVKLCAKARFSEKRIGYLGLMLLLDETQQVLMLVTNSLKQDLKQSMSPYTVGLALCTMGNIASADIARDLSSEVRRLLQSGNPYIRKKAALCAVRIVQKVPEMLADFVSPALKMLSSKNHEVLLTGVILMIEMIRRRRKTANKFRKAVKVLMRHLKDKLLKGNRSEYDVVGINDPFLQCKIIELLRMLAINNSQTSSDISIILAQVANYTDPQKNPGTAVLYECVKTIMAIDVEDADLRQLAISTLGKFLVNRDNNIRYVALNTLCNVIHTDAASIRRHKRDIVDCLKDPDISIRRRALELIYALVTKGNVAGLVKELVKYLSVTSAEVDFKQTLSEKIVLVAEKFTSDPLWSLNTLLSLVEIAGGVIRPSVASDAVLIIGHNEQVQAYAVHRLFAALKQTLLPTDALSKLAIFCIGEYGNFLVTTEGAASANAKLAESKGSPDPIAKGPYAARSPDDILAVIKSVTSRPTCTQAIKAYALNALLKLSGRLSGSGAAAVQALTTQINQYQSSMSVELQQRSCEYAQLLKIEDQKIRAKVMQTMPTPKIVKRSERTAKAAAELGSDGEDDTDQDEDSDDSDDSDEDDSSTGTEDSDDEEYERQRRRRRGKRSKKSSSSRKARRGDADRKERKVARAKKPAAKPVMSTPSEGPVTPAPVGPIDIFGGIVGATAPASSNGGAAAPVAPAQGTDLLDILGGGGAAPAAAAAVPAQQPATTAAPAAKKRDFVVNIYNQGGVKTVFQCRRNPASPGVFKIRAVCSSSVDVSNFEMKVAVPPWMTKQMKPSAFTTLSPGKPEYQYMTITHQLESGKKPLMKVKMAFVRGGAQVNVPVVSINLDDY